MKKYLKIGQTVYIQGYWKAIIRKENPDGHFECDVYEGLGSHDPVPARYTYMPSLLHEKKQL